jgi:hypothetical protein
MVEQLGTAPDESQETVFGGGHFNRFGVHMVVAVLIIASCLIVYGIHRAGVTPVR